MEVLAWTLIDLGALVLAACAVHLRRRHRDRDDDVSGLARSVHRTAPVLLVATLLPVPALLAGGLSAAAWGAWGALTMGAALVYAVADTWRDIPPHGSAPPGQT
ncbi:hypothetical protein [Streptomyces bambusae]|uniref:Uncharacterized protein n=1 Tax=Streptomyces bambusae TaxID=1550616 RepID=A0ABS6YYB8_9ACTN|nr:hypothetical protein [Streptomyces bambusae]MBW5480478.1 hypothetical protein [Streptomyces bambusae]